MYGGSGTGGRVFMSFCNIADCDNLILQLMLIGFHCAAIPGDPHTCYIASICDKYIRCMFYSMTRVGQLNNLFLVVVNVLFILGNIYIQIHSFILQVLQINILFCLESVSSISDEMY